MPPKQALETIANGDVQVSGVSKLMPKYEDLCRRLSELEDLPLADLIDFVLPEEEEGLEELRDIALISSADADSVQNFFNRMKTYITQPEMPEANDFVRVMSLHKSKGLTCKVVIVLGCVQGLIPGEDREDTTDEERMATLREQRRLFYFALTRCTEVLVLSSSVRIYKKIVYRMGANVRRWQANFANVVASQFLDELGPDAPSAIAGQTWAAGGYSPKD